MGHDPSRPAHGQDGDAVSPRLIAITDPRDERLADYVRLTDVNLRRLLDTERGLYMAESEPVVRRALAAGHVPRSVLVAESRRDTVAGLGLPADVPVYVVPDDVTATITGYDVHRGVIAAMNRPPLPTVADVIRDVRRVVVLEDLTNHTNVGAIFRSVAALGADAVLVTPRCADPLYRRSVRVSMGTVFQVPWTRIAPWPRSIATLRDAGFTIAAFTPGDGSVPLDEFAAAAPKRLALVFGTEGPGLDRRTVAAADVLVAIPMSGGVSSLNVAATGAVAMWALRP